MDQNFWKLLSGLCEPEVIVTLVSDALQEATYEQTIDLSDIQYIGDNLSGMQSFNFAIAIFKIP